jgi:hypothetical protein
VRLNVLMRERQARINASKTIVSMSHHFRTKPVKPFPNGVFVWIHVVESNKKKDPDSFCAVAGKLCLDALQESGHLMNDGWTAIRGLRYTWSLNAALPGVFATLTETEVLWTRPPSTPG